MRTSGHREGADLGPTQVRRRSGQENFHEGSKQLGFRLLDFWQWSASDLLSNSLRGVVAEYLVARALDADQGVREEWASWDLTTRDGIRVEVKSSAYVQSWGQTVYSTIRFQVPRTQKWERTTNRFEPTARRQADVYVFAVLAHKDPSTIDPMDVAQWEFYVVKTEVLDRELAGQKSLGIKRLREIAGEAVGFGELERGVRRANAERA